MHDPETASVGCLAHIIMWLRKDEIRRTFETVNELFHLDSLCEFHNLISYEKNKGNVAPFGVHGLHLCVAGPAGGRSSYSESRNPERKQQQSGQPKRSVPTATQAPGSAQSTNRSVPKCPFLGETCQPVQWLNCSH